MVRVTGEVVIQWCVDLPDETMDIGVVCDDPAVEAVICAIPQSIDVYIWGEDHEPAKVFMECNEADVAIEEDEREELEEDDDDDDDDSDLNAFGD